MTLTAPGDAIRAEDHNELVRGLRTITFQEGHISIRTKPMPHPWKCRVQAGEEPGVFEVVMLRGFVNDVEATVAYKSVDDPRGWTRPDDFPAAFVNGGICGRSWSERDQPPFLLLKPEDFLPVGDGARPRYFRSEAAWEKSLWVASVYLYARMTGAPARYRTWAGKITPRMKSDVLGVRELARVYVLRGEEPEDQEAFVHQLEFYDLFAQGVQPVKLLPDAAHIPDVFGALGFGFAAGAVAGFNATSDALTQIINGALGSIQQETASVEWWSV